VTKLDGRQGYTARVALQSDRIVFIVIGSTNVFENHIGTGTGVFDRICRTVLDEIQQHRKQAVLECLRQKHDEEEEGREDD